METSEIALVIEAIHALMRANRMDLIDAMLAEINPALDEQLTVTFLRTCYQARGVLPEWYSLRDSAAKHFTNKSILMGLNDEQACANPAPKE